MSCFREIAPRCFSNSPCCRDSPPIFAVAHAPLPTNRPTKFTIPCHVEPSQRKTFIAPVSSCKTEGEIPSPIAGSQNIILIVPPLSSLFQSCIGRASRSLCARSRNLRRHCPQSGTPIAPSPGHTTKSKRNYTRTSEGEASPWLHRRRGPQCGSAAGQCYSQFPPQANEEVGVRTGNDECAHQSSTEKKRKRLKKKERRGASSLFVRRNEEKPGAFAK